MNRKTTFAAILLVLILVFTGCGAAPAPQTPSEPEKPLQTEPEKPAQPQPENPGPSGNGQPEAPAEPDAKPEASEAFEPSAKPSLSLSKEEYPKIDGSTVTIPLSEAIYARLTGCAAEEAPLYVKHNTTHNAYVNLIHKDCDLIFVTSPSEEELQEAAENNVELEVVPIVSEAFVFLVSADNKTEGLTHQQILDIYSGKITNWKDVGGDDVEIRAFQRPVNSGSQTGMIDLVMGDTPLAEPMTEQVTAGMGELIDAVAVYDGEPDAIGYSYYYYVNDMWGYNKTKLLAIDGVVPCDETVADGSYRYHTAYYAVFRKDEKEDSTVRKVVDWILSDEGQTLAEDSGYVKLGK